jgi:hypothetical protein
MKEPAKMAGGGAASAERYGGLRATEVREGNLANTCVGKDLRGRQTGRMSIATCQSRSSRSLWGATAFLLNYIPILGPLFGTVIFLLAGMLSFESLWVALVPPALYFGIHLVEGETLTPTLVNDLAGGGFIAQQSC